MIARQTKHTDPKDKQKKTRSRASKINLLLIVVCLFAILAVCVCLWHVAQGDQPVDNQNAAQTEVVDGSSDSTEQKVVVPGASNRVNVNQLADSSFLYDTSIAELSAADSFHDDQVVQVIGEAVGEAINAEADPNHCWVTLQELENTGNTVVSVFMTHDQAASIDQFGRYGVKGSTVQVRGVYHLDCPEHQGLSDIHADEVSVIDKGSVEPKPINTALAFAGVLFFIASLVLFALYQRKRNEAK